MRTRSHQKIHNGETGQMLEFDLYTLDVQYEPRVDPNKTEKDYWEDFFKFGLNAYNKRKADWFIDFVDNEHFRDLVSVILQLKAMHLDQSRGIRDNKSQQQIRNNNM